jgi:hypothetical protein
MVKRITHIGGPGTSEMMWVAYRDYCDKPIVENSEWHSDSEKLIKFINSIECKGGGGDGPEAVEMGLKFVNSIPGVTRVILIADAEPHLEGKGNIVEAFKKELETDYIEQSNLLATQKIPIYCFYMTTGPALVDSFTKIASITGGKAAFFGNVNSLVDVITESVLGDIGGDEMVLEYRKTYHS